MSNPDFYMGLEMNEEEAIAWLQRIRKGLGDARPMWKVMLPKIKNFVGQEFTQRNPNKWKELTPKYKAWKIKKGYFPTIGMMKGRLRTGAQVNPAVKMTSDEMLYAVNQSGVQEGGTYYAGYFNRDRKLFKWTIFRINTVIEGITLKHIDKQLRKAE